MPTLSEILRGQKDPRLFLFFGNQRPRPPRNRLYVDLEGGLRILLELPGLLRVSSAAISHGPCRLSVYQERGTDFELRALRVCGSPIELARDGGDGGAEVVIDETTRPPGR